MRWLLPVLILAALATPASASAKCKNLKVTAGLKEALVNAHGVQKDGALAEGQTFYGKCGTTKYAIATFENALADQPEKFSRKKGKAWKDRGDGFENGCDKSARSPIPAALVKIWGVCPKP
jgi:hypothetical protein